MVQDVRSMSIWTGPTNPYTASPFLFELKIVHCLYCIKFRTTFPSVKTSTLVLDLTTHCIFLLVYLDPYRYFFFDGAPFIWNALPGWESAVVQLLTRVSFRRFGNRSGLVLYHAVKGDLLCFRCTVCAKIVSCGHQGETNVTHHAESTMFAITFCELFDALYLFLFIDCLSGRAENFFS